MPAVPQAFLLTWSAYGMWLHGDERGSVDATHRAHGTPRLSEDRWRQAGVAERLSHDSVLLSAVQRETVAAAVRDHCGLRVWPLLALNVRTNHVHVVVASRSVPPERVVQQLKAWSTRRLREAGLSEPDAPVWSKGASTGYLWEDHHVSRAVEYVTNEQ